MYTKANIINQYQITPTLSFHIAFANAGYLAENDDDYSSYDAGDGSNGYDSTVYQVSKWRINLKLTIIVCLLLI